ncbi:hypothetical protein HJFPF1_05827 [Paramyrothecium foliicola]|nr:hypothetical protein HJFPF1_05827 [Paramyrothecium foliicola]
MTDDEYHEGLKHLQQSCSNAVEEVMARTGANVIMASGESLLPSVPACVGYSIASLTLGIVILQRKTAWHGDHGTERAGGEAL